jgi:hypothetical protein
MSSNSNSGAKQCSHVPNSILELHYVLSHPALQGSSASCLATTAKLFAVSKAVAAAAAGARSGRSGLLQELHLQLTHRNQAQHMAAWVAKHVDTLQGLHTLQLVLDRATEGYGKTAASTIWGTLTSRFAGIFSNNTITAAVPAAATILQSMPRTLSKVNLQLQGDAGDYSVPLQDHECALLRSALAALPNLQSISIAGPGAAACLPHTSNLTPTFSQLTSLRLGTIRSQAAVAELLQGLPASLLLLRLDVDTPDRLEHSGEMSGNDWEWLQELQRSVQTAHLTALTTLHVTGKRFVVGRDSQLPPNLIKLTLPMVLHERPLLQLDRLQHLDIANLNQLPPAGIAGIAQSLTQLTHLEVGFLNIEESAAPQKMSALAALPLKSLSVASYGPQQPGAAPGVTGPATVGVLLGQLTSLTSLTLVKGAYAWGDLAASLAQLTGLQELVLLAVSGDRMTARLLGDVADCESFVDVIVGLEQLRCLVAVDGWFVAGAQRATSRSPSCTCRQQHSWSTSTCMV